MPKLRTYKRLDFSIPVDFFCVNAGYFLDILLAYRTRFHVVVEPDIKNDNSLEDSPILFSSSKRILKSHSQ